ncbi:Crp/Fnr family transcriptional regulator [Allomuricauda sp. d1]|uniref:Crp/Fnr family transcriptional regulator n=1 Tax=Allomuricauda sp. d1 TaxID=3136725 RepID=UPI0031D75FFE
MDNGDFLVNYFSQYVDLTEEEVDSIRKADIIREYTKGDVLLRQGQIAKNCFLVLKGCVKRYYIDGGEEKIMEFYTENDSIAPVSYATKEPSEYYISCVEPCLISTGNEEKTQQVLLQFPHFAPIFMKIGESVQAKKQVSMDTYKNLEPEARYQKLMETRPDLLNRVPQYMIASYLGIQPESLSRIRKRMVSGK